MKTTKAQFNRFKKEFKKWEDRLGLHYQSYFQHTSLEDCYAEIVVNEPGKVATVRMCTEVDGLDAEVFMPEGSGKHEAIHLLLNRMKYLAECRYVTSGEIDMEIERLVRVLEKVL